MGRGARGGSQVAARNAKRLLFELTVPIQVHRLVLELTICLELIVEVRMKPSNIRRFELNESALSQRQDGFAA